MTDLARTALRTVGGLVGAGVAGVAYAAFVERTWFTLRRYAVPALPAGSAPVRILQVSDLHLTPGQSKKIEWVRSLAELDPDFVVNSGDNLAHVDAVPALLRAMEPLLERPGAFVLGSNDYFGPVLKNPARYLTKRHAQVPTLGSRLPVEELVGGLRDGGWADLNNARRVVRMGDHDVELVGVNDPHVGFDRYDRVSAPAADDVTLTMGLVHAPYQRVLDAMVADGASVVLAGHTHGGQLALPALGRPRDELRPRHPPRQGRVPVVAGCRVRRAGRSGSALLAGPARRRVPARLRWSRYLALRASALRLPARGDPAHPRRRGGLRPPTRCPDRFRWACPGRLSSGVAAPPGRRHGHGVWRSLVARVVRDDEAAGSNPVTPTVGLGP